MAEGTPGSQSALREANQRRLLDAVRTAGALTQAQIARATGLSAATVSNIVRELRDAGMVTTSSTSSGGRRAQSVALAPDTGLAVAVHVTGTDIRAAIADMSYEVLAQERIRYDADRDPDRTLRRAEWLVATLVRQARVDRTLLRGVGLALPGPLDPASGRLVGGTVLTAWRDRDLAAEFGDRTGLPVEVGNDARAAALGEARWGAGQGVADFAYLELSTSVGAALVLNREVYPGSAGLAGEFGHITVDEQGRICRCGNRGCLQTVVGGSSLLDLLPPRSDEIRRTLDDLVAEALDGDLGARRVVADAGRAVGAAAAMVCNVLNPSRLVVGGELAAAGPLLLDPIRETLLRQALPAATHQVDVVPGGLGEWAAVRGALALVVRAHTTSHRSASASR